MTKVSTNRTNTLCKHYWYKLYWEGTIVITADAITWRLLQVLFIY